MRAVALVHYPEPLRHGAHHRQREIRRFRDKGQECRGIDLEQLRACAGYYRRTSAATLFDDAHFANDAVDPDCLINRATADDPQHAFFHKVERFSGIAFVEQEIAWVQSHKASGCTAYLLNLI